MVTEAIQGFHENSSMQRTLDLKLYGLNSGLFFFFFKFLALVMFFQSLGCFFLISVMILIHPLQCFGKIAYDNLFKAIW